MKSVRPNTAGMYGAAGGQNQALGALMMNMMNQVCLK